MDIRVFLVDDSEKTRRLFQDLLSGQGFAFAGTAGTEAEANLWLEEPTGRVKILDFGLAKPLEPDAQLTQITSPGLVVGTPLGLATTSVVDPGGLNLTTRTSYEPAGTGCLRGGTYTVDLSTAKTVGDVVNLLNASPAGVVSFLDGIPTGRIFFQPLSDHLRECRPFPSGPLLRVAAKLLG